METHNGKEFAKEKTEIVAYNQIYILILFLKKKAQDKGKC